jgi:hypothetical protein
MALLLIADRKVVSFVPTFLASSEKLAIPDSAIMIFNAVLKSVSSR